MPYLPETFLVKRPFVFLNMASTVDGKITSTDREYPKFTSENDSEQMDALRAGADAILVGAGTIRSDDPELQVRSDDARRRRQEAGKPKGLITIIVLGRGTLSPESKVFQRHDDSRTIVATLDGRGADLRQQLGERTEIWELGCDSVRLPELLDRLVMEGVEKLLLEGGGELNAAMFSENLVDEINLTLCPALLGGREAPTIFEGHGWTMDNRRSLALISCHTEGHELFLRYRVERE